MIVEPERFRHVFYDTDESELAGMAANDPIKRRDYHLPIVVQHPHTDSLFNMADVVVQWYCGTAKID